MTTLDRLHAAVLNAPEDDVVRLVFADALEETGEGHNVARAELIRLQVAGADETRQRALLGQWLGAWVPPRWTAFQHTQNEWWRFAPHFEVAVARGFASAVRLTEPQIDWQMPGYVPSRNAKFLTDCVAALFAGHPCNAS